MPPIPGTLLLKPNQVWTPALLPNLVLWQDVSDTTTTTTGAGKLSVITDKSGAGIYVSALQATFAKQPGYDAVGLNGKPSIVTADTGTGLDLGLATPTAANQLSIFAFFRCTTMPQFGMILGRTLAATGWMLGGSQGVNLGKAATYVVDPAQESRTAATLNDDNPHGLVSIYDGTAFPGTTTTLYRDGGAAPIVVGSNAGNVPNTADHVSVGCALSGANNPLFGFTGHLGEWGLVAGVISAGNRVLLNRYGQQKWGTP